MALVDLSSDLSKFRSGVSREPKNTPEASKATNNKNFATFQPITAKLSQFAKNVERQEPKQLETKLSSTKLDDIRKIELGSILLNTVSRYSAINEDYNERNIGNVSLESIASRYDDIRREDFISRLTTSDIVISRQTPGQNNLTSPVEPNIIIDDATNNIVNPDIQIERSIQSFDRVQQSPIISPPRTVLGGIELRTPSGNIENPNVQIERFVQSLDRASQSVVINKDLVSPLNNIINPDIALERSELSLDRVSQSPNIITDTIKQGLVVDPQTQVLLVNNGEFHLQDESRLNRDDRPIKFITTSRLVNFETPREPDTIRYDGVSLQTTDRSFLNLDTVSFTNPRGRHENPDGSSLSIIGTQQVNFFPDTNAKGFVVKPQPGITSFTGNSVFGWSGNRTAAPTTNFITDVNGKGFKKFAQEGETDYNVESSKFGFTTPLETDYFDITKKYTTTGFKTFVTKLETAYKQDVSDFVWKGKREQAPEANFFDVNSVNSNTGFHKFAQIYDTKFVPDSSIFDFDGTSKDAPVGNYFDINGKYTSDGFNSFAQLYDTKYIPDASRFAWVGTNQEAPSVNYFDVASVNSNEGFHRFAQLYDSKYIAESSRFDWDGTNQNAPETNFFDLNNLHTTNGFHKFAQQFDTKYVPDSSVFTFVGDRTQAPEVNYFDLNGTNTSLGFHKFAQLYDTKYVHQSSLFDWDGNRQESPEVNYFDLNSSNTTTGFHRFAQLYDTKYVRDSSIFDWDGTSQNAPEVNLFDISATYTTQGFEKFTPALVTRYVTDSSRFTFVGSNQNAPEVDYFDVTKKYATSGFEKYPQRMVTKYIKDASAYDFNGSSRSAPKTNFFGDTKASGFTTFAQKLVTEYKPNVSDYSFKGTLPKEVNFFTDTNASGFTNKTPLLETKFKHESSVFSFKGTTPEPVDFLENTNASGFDVKIEKNETKFVADSSQFVFKGTPRSAKTANFFEDAIATGFTSFAPSLQSEFLANSVFTITGNPKEEQLVENTTVGPESRLLQKDSIFDWAGSRQDAPEIDFFKIQGTNPNGIPGFTKLFDNTETKLTDEFSRFSFASVKNLSKIKNAPYTTFFGYNPSERTGFMPGMQTGESTLYPIIDPVLRFDEIPNRRFEIEGARAIRRRLQTNNMERYAPLSLGKRPWVDGTLSATLENQVPNIKTNAEAGSYLNKYERGVKDNTEQRGYLTKWAITRRSPSELDKQYSKFNLRNDAFNRDLLWSQPFVLRGIQGGLEPERWGGGLGMVDEGITRGGIATQAERVLFDLQRVGKFLTSVRGLAWNAKQVGLQLMNPVVDVDPKTAESSILGYSSTLVFNPLSVAANVGSARIGFHVARHGAVSFDSQYLNRYETATVNRELMDENKTKFGELTEPTRQEKTKYNRLIGLMKELLPNSFRPFAAPTPPTPPPSDGAEDPNNNGIQNPTGVGISINGNSEIVRISSDSRGPQSKLGIGETLFHRASHPYLTHYTTAPNLTLGEAEPSYLETAKRDSFYAANSTYSTEMKNSGMMGVLKAFAYALTGGPTEQNEQTDSSMLPNSVQKPVLDNIQKLETFSPKYNTVQSRLDRITKDSISKTEALLANSVHPENKDSTNLLKQYKVANYDRLSKNDARQSRFFNDFRRDVGVDFSSESQEENSGRSFITNPNIARFDTRNLSERYGFGDQGRPGVKRDSPFVSTIQYNKFAGDIIRKEGDAEFRDYAVPVEKEGQYFRGDRINIIDYKRANFDINTKLVYELSKETTDGLIGTRDLIEFYFSSLVISGHRNCPAEVIVFRATFGNITDNHKPSWNAVKYMGRADPLYTYQGYEREISFDFTVHIGSRDELRASWRKLNYLASWTAPEYRDNGLMRGPMIRLNIGHLYRKMPGYISSLSYTFDNSQTTWETANLPEDKNFTDPDIRELSSPGALQLPKHIDVSVSFVPVGVYRPEFRGVMYSLYDDSTGGTNPENGLVPSGKDKVNYFIEYYDKDGTPIIYSGTTTDSNGKRVSLAAQPISTLTPPTDTAIPSAENKGTVASNGNALPSSTLVLQSSQNDSNRVDFTNIGRVLPTVQTPVSNGDSTKVPYQSNGNQSVPNPPSPITKQVITTR